MHFYRVTDTDCPGPLTSAPRFEHKQADAHQAAKSFSTTKWPDVRVELVDVPVDAASVGRILNDELTDDLGGFALLRTWRLSDRGALVECKNGE